MRKIMKRLWDLNPDEDESLSAVATPTGYTDHCTTDTGT